MERPRLALLYAPCTVNKSFLSPYDASIPFTPNLRKFAEHAVTFEKQMTEAGASGIAYASLFTGTQADRHRVFWHPSELSTDLNLIGESYAAAGYEGFYWNAHGTARAALNYAQGIAPENVFPTYLTGGDERFLKILDRLRSEPSYRAFVVTNLLPSHGPYLSPQLSRFLEEYPDERKNVSQEDLKRFGRLYFRNNFGLSWNFDETVQRLGLSDEEVTRLAKVVRIIYASTIHELDRLFGQVVDAIRSHGLFDSSLIVFTADHGEALYRDGLLFKWSHSNQLAPEVMSVPLLISAPDPRVTSRFYSGVTESIDVFPTMLGLSGIRVPASVQGTDLAKALTGREKPPERLAYSHTQVIPPALASQMHSTETQDDLGLLRQFHPRADISSVWVSVRRGDLFVKYRSLDGIQWGFEAFDLATDPTESHNLFDAEEPLHAQLAENLKRHKQRLAEAYRRRGQPRATIDEKDSEILRSLGYLR